MCTFLRLALRVPDIGVYIIHYLPTNDRPRILNIANDHAVCRTADQLHFWSWLRIFLDRADKRIKRANNLLVVI